MARESLIALEEARARWAGVRDNPKIPEATKVAALDAYIEAEKIHDRRLGIPVATSPVVSYILPLALLLLVLVAAIAGIANSVRVSGVVTDVSTLVDKNCETANDGRVAQLANLRNDLDNLQADRRLLLTFNTPAIAALVEAKTEAIEGKREAIQASLDAVADRAVKPGSARINCDD